MSHRHLWGINWRSFFWVCLLGETFEILYLFKMRLIVSNCRKLFAKQLLVKSFHRNSFNEVTSLISLRTILVEEYSLKNFHWKFLSEYSWMKRKTEMARILLFLKNLFSYPQWRFLQWWSPGSHRNLLATKWYLRSLFSMWMTCKRCSPRIATVSHKFTQLSWASWSSAHSRLDRNDLDQNDDGLLGRFLTFLD